MADDTWYSVAVPILEYVHDHGGPMKFLEIVNIAQGTALDASVVGPEVDNLVHTGYLRGELHRYLGQGEDGGTLVGCSLGERGLRTIGAWPSDDPYEALLELLDRQIAASPDPAEKSAWLPSRTARSRSARQPSSGS